ncbi:RidA family protein [Thalassotalea sp. PLHSN55]|uniref:RidA family protein n=1 Tax=Thalassotalea sp. PLHSN55 TaxID=3435888 RepID=UPI003F85647E
MKPLLLSKNFMLTVAVIFTLMATGCAKLSFHSERVSTEAEFLNSKPSNTRLPFSEAVRTNDLLFLSGQIGFNAEQEKLVSGGLKAETKQTLTNIKTTLTKYGYRMKDVVKCTVMLTDINDFAAFNQVYTQFFTPPYPARSAFAVKDLALNSKVEVECIAKA